MMVHHQDHEDDLVGKAYDAALMRRFGVYVRPHVAIAAVGLALILLSTLVTVALPWLQGQIVTDLERPEGLSSPFWEGVPGSAERLGNRGGHLELLALIFLGAHVIKVFSDALQIYVLQIFGQRVIHDLRMSVFAHLQRVSPGYYQRTPVGTVVTRLSNDIEAMGEFVTAGLVTLVRDVVLMTSACLIMPLVVLELGLWAMAMLPVVVVVILVFRWYARVAYRHVRRVISAINAYTAESINGMAIIQAFAREGRQRAEFAHVNKELSRRSLNSYHYWAIFSPVVSVLSTVAMAIVLHKGAHMVLDREIGIGLLAAFLWWTRLYFDPVRDIAEKYNIFQAAMASAERIFQVLDEPEDPVLAADGDVQRLDGSVVFENVTFGYDPERPVLQDVSFTAEPGQKIALVGHTGAGKSTLLRLLLRFADPDSGRILVDGRDTRELAPRPLRERIGVVHQEVFLFRGDILENIRLWDEDITETQVATAAAQVDASEFIDRRPDGLRFQIEERGARLSSGERQLISFARALVRNPDILVLDEATALIDSETEALIQEALKTVTEGRTALLVAHRLSTIQHADLILVLHHGRIVERGTHAELLAQKGHYWKLYRLQQQEE